MMKSIRIVIPLFILSLAFVTRSTGTTPQQQLPDGEGKEVFANKCSQCHVLEYATATRRTRGGWNSIINEMVENGAFFREDERKSIIAYLSLNFGKISINSAPADEIESFLGMSSNDAKAIVSYRTEHGPFESLDDLKKVPEIDLKILDEKRGWIAY